MFPSKTRPLKPKKLKNKQETDLIEITLTKVKFNIQLEITTKTKNVYEFKWFLHTKESREPKDTPDDFSREIIVSYKNLLQ